MDFEQLSILVAVLAAISVAAERLVEIIRNLVPQLRDEILDPDPVAKQRKEALRQVYLVILTLVASFITTLLIWPAIETILPETWRSSWWGFPAVFVLGSGGSTFWNGFAGYIGNLREFKKQEAEAQQLSNLERGQPLREREQQLREQELELQRQTQALRE